MKASLFLASFVFFVTAQAQTRVDIREYYALQDQIRALVAWPAAEGELSSGPCVLRHLTGEGAYIELLGVAEKTEDRGNFIAIASTQALRNVQIQGAPFESFARGGPLANHPGLYKFVTQIVTRQILTVQTDEVQTFTLILQKGAGDSTARALGASMRIQQARSIGNRVVMPLQTTREDACGRIEY